jgi:short subunit dehydrogenase-like uncharacterized protein
MRATPHVIDLLGGPVRVARDLGHAPSVVFNWKVRGVPRSRLLDVWAYAARRGIDLALPGYEDLALVPRQARTTCGANATTSPAAAAA